MSWNRNDWLKALALAGGAAAIAMSGGTATPAVVAAEGAGAGLAGAGAAGAAGAGLAGGAAAGAGLAGAGELTAQQAAILAAQQAAMQGAAEGGLASGGMFAAPGAAATQAAPSALSSGGLFSGPSMMGPGGIPAAPGMESLAAKDAVNIAYQGNQLSFPQFLGERAKTELMNMNQPGEWAARLGRNLDRAAGTAGKGLATNMAMRALMPQPGYQPQPSMPAPRSSGPGQLSAGSPEQALADYQAGRISLEELKRKLGVA